MVISVPGSSANLGPGFDSIGLAVNRYLTLTVTPADEWYFSADSQELKGVPSGKDNLIYEVCEHVANDLNMELPACHVEMASDIPLARGLGSSAAAIVAGIELANQLLHANLPSSEKARIASLWEGHPDNVSASVYGGLVIGTHTEESTEVVPCPAPEVEMVLMVPSEELKTKKARGVLPESLPYKDAIKGGSIGNVLVAAIFSGDWELAGKMMVRDLYHHPYRAELVPGLEDVLASIHEYDAYGAALSGAGPTIICFTAPNKGEQLKAKLKEAFPQFSHELVYPDREGIKVKSTVATKLFQ
ncbi:homoserine kinase [Desertibacillus haloalkaliphilus]|nr:homoserine kinase [Desertibacillus haloalkaliphilus]